MSLLSHKKILYLVKSMDVGGAEKFTYDLAFYFAKLFAKTIVCSSGGLWVKELETLGIEHYTIPRVNLLNPLSIINNIIAIRKIIAIHQPDIIHIQHRIVFAFLPFLSVGKIKILYTAHNYFDDIIQKLIKPDYAIGISESIYQNLLSTIPLSIHQIKKINYGVDISEDNPDCVNTLTNLIRLGFVGRFIKEKGIYRLLEAVKKLKVNMMNIHLYLIGDGPEIKSIQRKIIRDNLENTVLIISPKTQQSNIYDYFDILILPTFLNEGLPISILEAMSFGKIIIATDKGGIKDAIIDGFSGYILNEISNKSIANKIIEVVQKGDSNKRVTKNAHDIICRHFDIKNMLKKYEKVYEKMICN